VKWGSFDGFILRKNGGEWQPIMLGFGKTLSIQYKKAKIALRTMLMHVKKTKGWRIEPSTPTPPKAERSTGESRNCRPIDVQQPIAPK
jgi:hypothetical protein